MIVHGKSYFVPSPQHGRISRSTLALLQVNFDVDCYVDGKSFRPILAELLKPRPAGMGPERRQHPTSKGTALVRKAHRHSISA